MELQANSTHSFPIHSPSFHSHRAKQRATMSQHSPWWQSPAAGAAVLREAAEEAQAGEITIISSQPWIEQGINMAAVAYDSIQCPISFSWATLMFFSFPI